MKKKNKKKALRQPKLNPTEALLKMTELYQEVRAAKAEDDLPASLIEEYHELQELVINEFAPLIQTMVEAGLFTSVCWASQDSMAAFDVEDVSFDGGFQLHGHDVVAISDPKPKFDFDSLEVDDVLANFKFDKNKPN